jgi:hypothetical protein
MSVESILSASADAESVEATCSKCNGLLAESRRSYIAMGAYLIIQLKRFRWNAALGTDSKVSKLSSSDMLFVYVYSNNFLHSPGFDFCRPLAHSQNMHLTSTSSARPTRPQQFRFGFCIAAFDL